MAYTTIDDPSAYFQTKLYTGTGSSLALTNDGNSDLQPDWVWIKERNGATNQMLTDSVRGATKTLHSQNTDTESTDAQALNYLQKNKKTQVGRDILLRWAQQITKKHPEFGALFKEKLLGYVELKVTEDKE